MESTNLLDDLLRICRADTYVYDELMKYTPAYLPPAVESRLMLKLLRVREILEDVPDEDEECFNDWTERLIMIWLHHCVSTEPTEAAVSPAESMVNSFSAINITEASTSFKAEPILKAVIPSSYPVYKPAPRNPTFSQEEENFPKDNSDRALSRTALKAKMQDCFFDLQIDSATDIDGLAAMLRLVSRASKLVDPYKHDHGLKHDLFGYAWAKLPSDLLRRVTSELRGPRTLASLFHWLRGYIKDIYQKQQIKAEVQYIESVSQYGDSSLGDPNAKLCFQCYHLGHTKKSCANEELPIALN